VIVDLGLRTWDGKTEKAVMGTGVVVLPKGSSAGLLNGFEHKQFIDDLFLAKRDPAKLEAAGKKDITPGAAGDRRRRAQESRRASSTC
jgi:hypothetical protein